MSFLPKVKKGIASALSKTEKIRKAVLGVALVTSVATAALVPNDVSAAQTSASASAPVLLTVYADTQPGYHYSHSSHASHSSHQSHYSSR